MAQILNVEKPQYINQVIDIYAKNKIGQYSKYLEKAPTYVTYYHINEALSMKRSFDKETYEMAKILSI